MNENKAIALEIIKLHSGCNTPKETAEKYNEVLSVLDNRIGKVTAVGLSLNTTREEAKKEEFVSLPKGFILRFEFGTFRVMEDIKIQVVSEKVATGGIYGIGGPASS